MHAYFAVRAGHEVVQIERDAQARSASVRNFGLVWVSGRASGAELDTALRARELWEEIGKRVSGVGFRSNGSLTVVRTEAELAVAQEVSQRSDAEARGWKLLTPTEVKERNPGIAGTNLGALYGGADAAIEPRVAQRELHDFLTESGKYTWLPNTDVVSADQGRIRSASGQVIGADQVIVCPGSRLGGFVQEWGVARHVRKVRLQMMQTAPMPVPVTTSVADGDSFRYYPAYQGKALDDLNASQPQHPTAHDHKMQLLLVQRLDGSLTIGDTHEYDEPFGFDVTEAPYGYLSGVASEILGQPIPPTTQRWAGVYAQCVDKAKVVHREQVADGVWVVVAPGGRGMTCSPAIAEQTLGMINA
jgi:FAD dependent oxidoreductase TIGR03364